MSLRLVPSMTLRQANELVGLWHRHHEPVRGCKFVVGVADGDGYTRGAAIVGRPLSRMLQDGYTAEVTRLVTDGTPNACSILYGACWRAWQALGGTRIVTYVLATEPGVSLRAAGWRRARDVGGFWRGWDRDARPRKEGLPKPEASDAGQLLLLQDFSVVPQEGKVRWEAVSRDRAMRGGPPLPPFATASAAALCDEAPPLSGRR